MIFFLCTLQGGQYGWLFASIDNGAVPNRGLVFPVQFINILRDFSLCT